MLDRNGIKRSSTRSAVISILTFTFAKIGRRIFRKLLPYGAVDIPMKRRVVEVRNQRESWMSFINMFAFSFGQGEVTIPSVYKRRVEVLTN